MTPAQAIYFDVVRGVVRGCEVSATVVGEADGTVVGLYFGERTPEGAHRDDGSLRLATGQLEEYLAGSRQRFDLALRLPSKATDFTRRVLETVAEIPYGASQTYLDIATAIDRPRAARAVGRVMAANPLPLVIPCHRVLGSSGKLCGFGGGIKVKQALIEMERLAVHNARLRGAATPAEHRDRG